MKGIPFLAISILVFGFFFLVLPQNIYAGTDMTALGCCVDNNNVCLGCGEFENCSIPGSQCELINGNFTEGQACFENLTNWAAPEAILPAGPAN